MIEGSFSGLVAGAVDPHFEEGFEVVFKEGGTASNIVLAESPHSGIHVLQERGLLGIFFRDLVKTLKLTSKCRLTLSDRL